MEAQRSLALLIAGLLATTALATDVQPALETDDHKTLYTIGRILAQRLGGFELSAEDVEYVTAGVREALLGVAPRAPIAEFEPRMNELLRTRMERMAEREKAAGLAFLERAAGEPGAIKTDSGLIYFEIVTGAGDPPAPTATVKLHYKGKLPDGTVFSSTDGGEPESFALTGVVPCFAEGILRMRVGGKSKLVCPPAIAYGNEGRPPTIRPGATLVFEIELVAITGAPAPERATP